MLSEGRLGRRGAATVTMLLGIASLPLYLHATHPYEQLDAATIEFRVDVPPGEEVAISYTVQYSWP